MVSPSWSLFEDLHYGLVLSGTRLQMLVQDDLIFGLPFLEEMFGGLLQQFVRVGLNEGFGRFQALLLLGFPGLFIRLGLLVELEFEVFGVFRSLGILDCQLGPLLLLLVFIFGETDCLQVLGFSLLQDYFLFSLRELERGELVLEEVDELQSLFQFLIETGILLLEFLHLGLQSLNRAVLGVDDSHLAVEFELKLALESEYLVVT